MYDYHGSRAPSFGLEKGQSLALHHECKGERHIAEHIERSKTAVHNFLCTVGKRRALKKAGRKPKISKQQTRALLRHAATGKFSARDLKKHLNLSVSLRRVQELLHNSGNLFYKKKKSDRR